MKKILCYALMLVSAIGVSAKEFSMENARISNIDVARTDNNLFVSMDIDMSEVKIKSNQELIVTPVIRSGSNELKLQPVTFAGRNRYYYHLRNDGESLWLHRDGREATQQYRVTIPFEDWMKRSQIDVDYAVDGCCNDVVALLPKKEIVSIDMEPPVYTAEFVYIPPKVEESKIREESGQAFIDFPVNLTEIFADYRNNPRELAKIAETIDKIRNDKDVTITAVSIKGYASPEGSYSNNVRLAKGRTASLKDYVNKLYAFPENFIKTSYDPEDWGGLRKFVEKSNLANKDGILAIIDSDLEPDPKDNKIKTTYPEDYVFLLKNEYPALRHSDYVVEYKVRSYYDPVEILKVMREAPQKLSQSELYAAAQTLEPGSADYNEVFEVAVRMFPGDPVANLNAANAAMARGDFSSAKRYLDKSGNSDEAEYARGVYSALNKDYPEAEKHFAAVKSISAAAEALAKVKEIQERKETVRVIGK